MGFYDTALKGSGSSTTEAFSSLDPMDCSDPQELPAFCPVLISQPSISILALSSSSTQLEPTLSFPGFYCQAYFLFWEFSPFSTPVTLKKASIWYHKTNRYGCPKTLSFQRLGRSAARSRRWPKTPIKRMCNSSTPSMMETTAALAGGQDAHENKATCVADYNKHMAKMGSTDQMLESDDDTWKSGV